MLSTGIHRATMSNGSQRPVFSAARRAQWFSPGKKNVFGVSGCLAVPQHTRTPELLSPLMPACFSQQQEQSGQPFTNNSHFPFYAQLSGAVMRQLSTALCREPSPSSGGCCHWCQLAMFVPCHALVPANPSQTLLPIPFSPEL